MYYIIGPKQSADALARKNGLRAGEWKPISRLQDARGRSFGFWDVVLSTHDAVSLSDYGDIEDYVESHTMGEKGAET